MPDRRHQPDALSKVPMTAVALLHDRLLPFYFGLYCALESNGIVERFNRTLKEEFFSVAYRKRLHESVEALRADRDGLLSFYNERQVHH